MSKVLEIPVYDEQGEPTGRTATVPSPPPAAWRGLELQTVRELERFGCGCIWHERRVYAPRGRSAASDAGPGQ